ncbi:zinc finger protein-like [Tropilaelaps mercedesae]|uniref:Zinc finger protein-like n=1 Tax=Tropilaelaps mercedesae TaxID=418985 RepID=A0A1V9XTN5_9ACAR|nr:zinc finger protein-like [Tropilaelaps mercedesae]
MAGMNGLSPVDLLQLTMVAQEDEEPMAASASPGRVDKDDKEHDDPNPDEPYYCPLCNFSTKRPGLLLRHTFDHTGVQPYSCWKCLQRFTLPESLVEHFVQEHSITGQPLKCGTCRKAFSTRRGLVTHQLQFSIQKTRFCYFCAKGFGSDGAEREHQRAHSPGLASSDCFLRCLACRRLFPNEDALRIHSVFHLSLQDDRFIRPSQATAAVHKARRFFQQRRQLPHGLAHNLSSDPTRAGTPSSSSSKQRRKARRKFSCEHCDKVFVSRTSLRWHARLHRRPFTCRACPRAYSTLCALLVHAADHDTIAAIEEEHLRHVEQQLGGSAKKPPSSSAQGSASGSQLGLTTSGALGLPATLTSTNTGLAASPSVTTPSASTERHECPTCGKAFGSANSLRAHKKSHTTGKTPHKCPTCGKQFVRSYDMKRHMRTHDSSAPYVCQICHQKFSQSSSLKKHYKTHRIHCPLCLKQFDVPDQLTAHVPQCPAQQAQQSLLAAAISNMSNMGHMAGLNGVPPEALAGLMQAAQGMMQQASASAGAATTVAGTGVATTSAASGQPGTSTS